VSGAKHGVSHGKSHISLDPAQARRHFTKRATSSSYPPSRNVLSNLRSIGEEGIRASIQRQLEGCNDGSSRSFFGRAAPSLDPEALTRSLDNAKKAAGSGKGGTSDTSTKARLLKEILAEAAVCEGIELKASK
jgi:hypothetical protein